MFIAVDPLLVLNVVRKVWTDVRKHVFNSSGVKSVCVCVIPPLQDMQVSGVEDDSRALNITIHKPTSNPHAKPVPILQASFIFADHIRCIIAKQRLAKGRIQARRMKMQRIAGLSVCL